jgi:hypothetical protein
LFRTYLKIIFGFEIKADPGFKPQAYGRIRKDLKPESNIDIGPKDYFGIASTQVHIKKKIK